MRCFSCDMDLQNPYFDKPTGRYYCNPCFEATTEEMLAQFKLEDGEIRHWMAPFQDVYISDIEREEEELDEWEWDE